MWNESLFNAVRQGDIADILLCLENGADVNFKYQRMFGWTPLICATELGHFDVVKLLLANGADANILNDNDINALIVASYNGYFEIVKILVKHCTDMNYINKALQWAKTDEIKEYLISAGAENIDNAFEPPRF